MTPKLIPNRTVAYRAVVLDETDPEDRHVLDGLRADPQIEFLDHRDEQLAGLRSTLPAPGPDLTEETTRWAYYPWRRAVAGVLGPNGFGALRSDRNRNLITAEEQLRLRQLKVGVVGLSVGHVIAHTLVAQSLCGEIRLADFDTLELSNLNRLPATVLDLGQNKAVLAARRIAELDPYQRVAVFPAGVTEDNIDEFLIGLDAVVEECDSLDMKAAVREQARARKLPVLMATSDRGLVDIERFDLEPDRPILHGLIGETDSAALAGMTARQKIPHMLGHLDVPRSSPKAAASMVEVGVTVSTWPQLAGEVVLGAAAVTEAVRRIGLGEELPSGRVRIDVAGALDSLEDPARRADPAEFPPDQPEPPLGPDAPGVIAAAAMRAPSGGNAQPWDIEIRSDAVTIRLAPQFTSTMDVGSRGAAIAVGAALYNARVAAAAHGVLGEVDLRAADDGAPLTAVVQISDPAAAVAESADLARWYPGVLRRETSRRLRAVERALDPDTAALLTDLAEREGARLRLITSQAQIADIADILGQADRIRYLSPELHAEMMGELRFATDADLDTGIDIRTLELDVNDRAVLEILQRPDVMAHLAQWDVGAVLARHGTERIRGSAALAMVIVSGDGLVDYARGGAATEAVWVAANTRGLAVQPVSPVFVHARTPAEVTQLSPHFATELAELKTRFDELLGIGTPDAAILLLRLDYCQPPSVRSRRSLDRVRHE